MKNIGFIYDPVFLKHEPGYGHPESPERLEAIMRCLPDAPVWPHLVRVPAAAADEAALASVHAPEHVETIRRRIAAGDDLLDQGDTRVCRDSWAAALAAAGGAMAAVDAVLDPATGLDAAFCALRPPGHHAESRRAMGFCLFNNIAVAARYAQAKKGVGRIAILDWDVHHGNGTQEIFYKDPSVLYISLHQYPWYPGTGAMDETGTGAGEGFTLNCPMPAGSGEGEYLAAFRELILPALENFRPQLLLISAGFDAHRDDPLSHIFLEDRSFLSMTRMAGEIAAHHAAGKIVSMLEGGYNLEALARCVALHCAALAE